MKKFLSMLLTVAIVLSTLCLPAVADDEPVAQSEPAIGEVADGYTPVDGSQAINTLADLQAISENLNDEGTAIVGNYHLTADITVTIDGTDDPTFPLIAGDSVKIFKGTFDGCGHTIQFVYENDAKLSFDAATSLIFGSLTASTVKNLIIDGASFTTSTGGAGVLAISVSTGGVVNVENVAITNASVSATSATGKNVGGFFGGDEAHSVNFTNCKFTGEITSAAGNVGGFIGKVNISGHIYVEGCEVDATLNSTANGGSWGVGGFLGCVSGNCSLRFGKTDDVAVEENAPKAANKVNMEAKASSVNAGGLVGFYNATPTSTIKIDDNTSYKNAAASTIFLVTGTNDVTVDISLAKQFAGGLVGAIQSKYTIADLGYGEEGDEGYVAPATGIVNIQQNVTVNGTVVSAGARAGGFIGHYGSNARLRMSRNGTLYAPTNNATVTGLYGAGGIIGILGATGNGNPGNAVSYDIVLNAVVNTGNVTETCTIKPKASGGSDRTSDAAGGIIGTVINVTSPDGPSKLELKNGVRNTGTITCGLQSSSGGMIGLVSGITDFEIEISHATNAGTIKNTQSQTNRGVGGILGLMGGSTSVTILNSTNTGAVSAKNKDGGGIVGRMASTGTLTVDNCVNSGTLTVTNYTGGLVSSVGAAGTVNVSNSMNTADLSGNYVGGIVVRAAAAATINITNCVNTGNLSGTKPGGAMSQLQNAAMVNIYNFHNGGDITGSSSSGYAGAFIAYDAKSSTATVVVKNSTNSGTIGGTGKVGVFTAGSEAASTAQANYTFENCLHFVGAEGTTDGVVFVPASEEEFAPVVTLTGCKAIAADYVIDSTSDLFRVLDGARIRLDLNETTKNGLRFDIAVDATLVLALEAAGYSVQLKSLMVYADNVTAATFNKAAMDAESIRYSDATEDAVIKTDGTYSAALINFAENQYNKDIACIGYIEATKDGETIYFYTAYDADNARSIEYVANAALEDETVDYSAYTEILNKFAGK